MESHLARGVVKWNPWLEHPAGWDEEVAKRLPRPFVQRSSAPGIQPGLPGKALLVVGPRQAGKSTLIWNLVQSRHRSCLYLHCEDPLIADWCTSPSLFAADFEGLSGPPEAIFIDEAQRLANAGLFVKGLVDLRLDVPIYVTGSSAYHLGASVRESLSGRASRLTLYPFSLAEVVAFEVPDPSPTAALLAATRGFERQMLYGCYPEVYLHDREERRLYDLVEAFVMRDASDLFRLKKPGAMRKLLHLMAGQVGNLVRMSEWAALCQVSAPTIAEYAGILEETHITRLLPVFHGGRRTELTAMPKVYFIDNGLRNLLVGDFSPVAMRADRGALFENWVFCELTKTLLHVDELHYWRTRSGAEVDFVIHRPGLPPVGIEAKLHGQSPKLSRGARSFLDAYAPSQLITVTADSEGEATISTTRCIWCRPHELAGLIPSAFRSPPS